MDARPSPEQRELADAADRLGRNLGPAQVGDLDDTDRRARLDAAMAQAGWRELRTGSPAEPMASGVEAAIVARSLARYSCDTAFIGPLLAHDLLRRAGGDGDGPARTIAVRADLRGIARLGDAAVGIDTAGSTAAVLLTEDGTPAEASVTTMDGEGVDLTRPAGAIGTASPLAGLHALGADDLLAWEALAVTLTAADLVGSMEAALELATEYAKQRRQYGAAIGSYQAVQHLLAEAKTLTEGSVSAMIHASWAVDALPPAEARSAAAVAKAYAARAARTVCETSIQVHGGIGNTWECMAHVHLRRALLSTDLFGGDGAQLSLLAAERFGA